MTHSVVKYFKLDPQVQAPVYSTEGAACFDISAFLPDDSKVLMFDRYNVGLNNNRVKNGKLVVFAKTRVLVPTGLIFDIPQGHSIRIHPRSGLAWKKGVTLTNCQAVIDSDYVEQTFVMLLNTTNCEFVISHGDRIAQGELVKDLPVTFDELSEPPSVKSNRTGGLGSTGVGS